MRRSIAALVLGAAAAHANVGYFAGSGQDIVLAATADVQMVAEDVTIVVRPEAAEYLCRFELLNLTDQAVELQAGFPLNGDWFDSFAHESRSLDGERQICDRSDSEIVADEFRFLARDDDATYHVRYLRHDAQQKFKHIFLWTMRFAPHERRSLHVSYDVPASETLWTTRRRDWEILTGQAEGKVGEGTFLSADLEHSELGWLHMASLHWYSYVTATGASWAGDIERADFHVRYGLADEALRDLFRKQMSSSEQFLPSGTPPPPDPGPLLTWLCLAPPGAKAPIDERERKAAEKLGVEWKPRPIPDAYDWHFAPFTPGPEIAIGWLSTMLPTTAAGVRVALTPPDPSAQVMTAEGTPLQSLPLFRAAIAAANGVAPGDEAQRAILEQLIWYSPVAGRTEADLSDDVKAQLVEIDKALSKAGK